MAQGLRQAADVIDGPFLPIITNKDLKELNRTSPILHLHRLRPEKLHSLSQFEIGNIRGTIEDKMNKYLSVA